MSFGYFPDFTGKSLRMFTKCGIDANSQVSNQLSLIVDEVKKSIPGVKSIILGGSFGYGEGPVKIIDGRAYPYNDYDIYAIVNDKLTDQEIDGIATEAAKRIGQKGISYFYNFKKEEQKFDRNFYVDLKCLSEKALTKLLPRLRYYKFKENTQILYGEDLRYLVPDFPLSAIPLSEAAMLLCYRMSQLVEYYSTKGEHCNEFLTYIIQQAYTACCTALLLLTGKYKAKYSDSADVLVKTYQFDFPELYGRLPDLSCRVKQLIDWRLDPAQLFFEDVAQRWFVCANDITTVSMVFFSKFLNRKIVTIDDLSKGISSMFTKLYFPYLNNKLKLGLLPYAAIPLLNLFFKYKYFVRIRELIGKRLYKVFLNWHSPDIIIFSLIPYILNSLKEGNVEDDETIDKALRLLRKIYPVRHESWEELTLDYSNAYISFFLQRI